MHSKEELKRAHEAIHKEHVHRRVRTALERRLMTSTKDMVKWGFKQWTVYAHMHSKEELKRAHEAIHKEHVHRRVRTALERRLMTSTKDMVKWGFKQWTVYAHMHSKEELKRAHEAIHKEHVHRRVRTALERRLMTSTKDMVKWGFKQWTVYAHMHSKEELKRAHEAIHKEHVHRRVRTALERRLMTSTKDMVKWGFKQWTVYAHMHSKREMRDAYVALHEEYSRRRLREFVGRRLGSNEKLQKLHAFRVWREMHHLNCKEVSASELKSAILHRDSIIFDMEEKWRVRMERELGAQNFQFQEDLRAQVAKYKDEIARITRSFEDTVISLKAALEEALFREQEAEKELKRKLDKAYKFGLECAQIQSEARFNETMEAERKMLERSYDEQLSKLLHREEIAKASTGDSGSREIRKDAVPLKFSHHK